MGRMASNIAHVYARDFVKDLEALNLRIRGHARTPGIFVCNCCRMGARVLR